MDKMSEVEIKALLYDHLVIIEKSKAAINTLNQELFKRSNIVEVPKTS